MKFIRQSGLTLIELMIALAIVAILAAITIPSYQRYALTAHRHEAIADLLKLSLLQERYRTTHNTYATQTELATAHGGSLPVSSGSEYYTFSVNLPNGQEGSRYTLTATAVEDSAQENDMAGSTNCSTLTLNAQGVKTPSACWSD
jgi:type IV pilus assembly protein PilE